MSFLTIALVVFALAAPFSLWFYGKFLRAYSRGETRVQVSAFGPYEAFVAILLVLCFLAIVALSNSSSQEALTLHTMVLGSMIYLSLAMLVIGVNVHLRNNPIELYGLNIFRPIQAILWIAAILPILYLCQEAGRHLFGDNPQEIISYILAHRDPATLLSVGVLTVVVAPTVEEFIFRGFLYGVISRYFGRYAALTFTALLFALIHVNLAAFFPLFLLAIFLSLSYERTGSLWTPIVMHASFNALAFFTLVCFPQFAQ